MRVTVLYGGPSAEREVSLVSGTAVIEGLRSMGHDVFASDVSPTNLSGLDHPSDVIFPVLHGEFGESGELQEILEQRKLPFVGSGSMASRIGIDKVDTKRVWEQAGLPTPAYEIVTGENKQPARIAAPAVVKAFGSGSSIDVFVCKTDDAMRTAIQTIVGKHGEALVEQYIKGPELTVGLLEEQPLAPIRIVPKNEFFDYEAKYQSKETEHRFDTGLPADVIDRCCALAKAANDVVGARDLARVDIMLDGSNNAYLLEINTLPGFTPVSLLPEAAKHAGIEFGPLVDRLVKRAHARGAGERVMRIPPIAR
ncbi:MAG TPA: D-alanine--D-alanine ligase [Tepidisphaeraceae bacterium]|nr:D-alanine--D-alanine ligase [Tepidisphaeraceae bacterium]